MAAYLIANIEVHDPEGFARYGALVAPMVARFGGRYLVRGGKLTPLAVSTPKRSAMLPNTPTLDEAGIKGIDASIWLGLFAPAGTPPAVVARLNAEINKVLQMPDVREKLINGGVTPMGGTSDEFATFVRTDYARWGKIVKDSGVKLE
jgi:tripartite-type tricarboxylate transporter receptor subunit TctC